MEQEIVIAGAGVAGLSAAIALRRSGRSVRVIERGRASGGHRFPDWDAVENWTSLEDFPDLLQRIGIDPGQFRHTGHSHFSVIDPYGRRYDVRTPRPFFYLVKRGSTEGGLERGLQRQAESLGISIAFETVCPPGRADIWAAGTYGQGSRFVSTGFTFTTDHPDWICGIVDRRIAPRAYAYLVVTGGEGTLAVVLTESRQAANQLLDRAVEVFQRHTELRIESRRKSGGSGGDLAAYWQGRQDFVIGESGGFQDFLWGFGIRHALTSGLLAAEAIVSGHDWQALADARLRPLVNASLVNRWLYDRMPNPALALLVRRFASDPDLNGLVGRWYHPRPVHRLLWPLARRHFWRESATLVGHARYQDRTRPLAPTSA